MDLFCRLLSAMSEVAHLIRHDGKPTTRLPRTRSLNGRVEGQQVGLLGDPFDYIEYVTNVVGAGVEGFDLRTGHADLLREFGHGLNGLLDHFAAIIRLLTRTAGMLRGIGGIACDLLGCSAQFIDGSGDAVGACALLV